MTKDEAQIEVISGGNFHGEPLALAMDYLAIALSELGNILANSPFVHFQHDRIIG